jgi:hypothetical protein
MPCGDQCTQRGRSRRYCQNKTQKKRAAKEAAANAAIVAASAARDTAPAAALAEARSLRPRDTLMLTRALLCGCDGEGPCTAWSGGRFAELFALRSRQSAGSHDTSVECALDSRMHRRLGSHSCSRSARKPARSAAPPHTPSSCQRASPARHTPACVSAGSAQAAMAAGAV